MKLNRMILATAAIVLPLSVGVGSALAYFTDNASAVGGYAVEVGPDTEMTETFKEWTKSITVTNKEDGVPVYVRVKAFSGSQYLLTYTTGGRWLEGTDGYYYYDGILEKGVTTQALDIKINGVPENATDKDAFNVIVVYERTPVEYNENGTPKAVVKQTEDGKWEPVVEYNEDGTVKWDAWGRTLRVEETFPTDPGNDNPDNTEDNGAGAGNGSGSEITGTTDTNQLEEGGDE